MTLVFRVDTPSAPDIVVVSCEVCTAESSEEACNNGVVSVVISAPGVSAKTVDVSEDVVTSDGLLDRGVVIVASLVDIPVD